MGTYKKINGQAVPVTTEGHPQYYFQTKAQAEAALPSLEVGADVFVEEGGNEDVLPRVQELEEDVSQIESDLTEIQKHTVGTIHELTSGEYAGYVVPSDGYIKAVISSSNASANYGTVVIDNQVIINIRTVEAQTQSVFVRKGSIIRAGGEGATLVQHYYFIPLV